MTGLFAGLAALAAAVVFAVADWFATGILALPPSVILASLLGAVAIGLLAIAGSWLLGRVGLSAALMLGALHALQWLAMLSKELGSLGVADKAMAAGLALLSTVLLMLGVGRCLRAAPLVALAIPLGAFVPTGEPPGVLLWNLGVAVPAAAAWLVRLPALRSGKATVVAPAVVLACNLILGLSHGRSPSRELPERTNVVAPGAAPSVLFVVVDTLRFDAILNGALSPGTPAIRRLAGDGVLFQNAISAAPWTLPSHASLFTGLYPGQHGAVLPSSRLGAEQTTLAEILQASGYQTAAFTGGGFLVPGTGLDQGFELFDGAAEFRMRPFPQHVPLIYRVARNRYLPLRFLLPVLEHSGGFAAVAAKATRWLEQRDDPRPFFLFVHTYQVHDYYVYQPTLDDHGAHAQRFAGQFAGRLWIHPDEILTGATALEVDALKDIYRNRLQHADAVLSELVTAVRRHTGDRPLLTLLTSDHGEGFSTDPRRLVHGGRLHDDLLRVPLLFHGEGIPAGMVVCETVSLVDVPATVLALTGIPSAGEWAGRSLVPLWQGTAECSGGPVFGEHGAGPERGVALRTSAWKLIDSPSGEEAYFLADDPRELRSSPRQAPARLWRELGEWRAAWEPRAPAAEFDAATLEHLRQLGYVE